MPLIPTGDRERDCLIIEVCEELMEFGAGFEWYAEIVLAALDNLGYEIRKKAPAASLSGGSTPARPRR